MDERGEVMGSKYLYFHCSSPHLTSPHITSHHIIIGGEDGRDKRRGTYVIRRTGREE